MTAPSAHFHYREHAPAPPLARSIACYWTIAATATPGHRVLPDGCMDILFDLDAPSGDIIGVMTSAIVTPRSKRARLLGVRFRPGEAFAFLDFPAREGCDRVLPLEDVWRATGRELHDQIRNAQDTAERVRILDRALLARRRRAADPRLRAAVDAIRAARGRVRIAVLAARTNLGERQLERLFGEQVGVGPKALANVARMQALISALTNGSRGWARLAAELGWADQSHLVRDLRSLAGITPTELLTHTSAMSGFSNPMTAPFAMTGP